MGNFYDKFKKSLCSALVIISFSFISFCAIAQQNTWKNYLDSAANKNPTSAIIYLEKALKEIPINIEKSYKKDIFRKLANAYASSNNLDKAIYYSHQLCAQFLNKNEKNPDEMSDYVKALLQTADWQRFNTDLKEAAITYRKVLDIHKDNENAIIGLIFTHYLLEDHTFAQYYIDMLNKVNKNNPVTVAFNAYAQINVNKTLIEEVERNNGKNIYVLLIVAAAYTKKNDVKTAIQKYDDAIKLINEEQAKENRDNLKNFNKYLKNFAFLEKANIYMLQKDFLRAEIEFSNLIKNGVKTLFVNFARIIAQKEHTIANQKIYAFSAEENIKLRDSYALKSTSISRQVARMVSFALKNISGNYDPNDPSNVWSSLIAMNMDIAIQNPTIEEHQLNLIKLYIKTYQTAKAKMLVDECIAKIKNDKAIKWHIEKFTELKKEVEIIHNDHEKPKVYVMSPQFAENLARGGGEKELSEEKFDILLNVSDNIGVEKITINGQQQNFSKAKEVQITFHARFFVEPGLVQSFVIDVYDKAGNFHSEKLEIRRKIKELAKTSIAKNSEKLNNKTLNEKYIGKQYLFLIATDEYTHWTSLNNAVLDMTTLHKTLKENYRVDSVVTVYNKTKEEIINAFYAVSNINFGENDQILIAIAGHGDFLYQDNRSQGRGFIVPKDARPKDKDRGRSSYISYSDLKDIINLIPCSKKLLLLDVCFAGTIDNRIATRGLPEIKLSDCDKANEFLKDNNKKEYSAVITSGGKESVFDGKPGENSPFMKEVLKALKLQGNIFGVVTADEFWNKIAEDHTQGNSYLRTTPHLSYIKEIDPKMLGTFLFFKK